MTVPALAVSAQPPLDSTADVLILGARAAEDGPVLLADRAFDSIADALSALGVTGGRDEVVRIPASIGSARSIAIVGVGSELTADALRQAAGSAVRQLTGVGSLAIGFPLDSTEQLEAVLEGAALGGYAFTSYRQASLAATRLPAAEVTVHTGVDAGDALSRALAVAEAMKLVKDLVNTPPSDMFPQALADRAVEAAAGLPVDVQVWDEAQLAAEGFGGILGVGQGSTRPPRLVKVSYSPADADKHVALVGKGITFDTGGLSLKPAASMVGMKYDMTGAATVLAVTLAAARLAIPVRLTAWLCIAENMPSGSAIRPEDVLRIRGGRTVEVLNTDAEGRLVLADGLVAAGEEHPDAIIDVATLTGAATVALGTRYFAVMGDEELVGQVLSASRAVDELAWPMPLPGELRGLLRSDVADIANAKIGNKAAGMLLAGVFLQEFIGTNGDSEDAARIPWAHLDIAGSAQNEGGGWGFTKAGPTGVSVRALIRLAEEISRP
ncbi:leucyl aminopeptidase [Glaciibacter sp. 2TAF33]|uniref:leucyl aminopeptidase n=1 Tax=Glaciibacter sp. 2TAF33 TaxID=3233015 RepID=UPI003F8D911A